MKMAINNSQNMCLWF